MDRLEHNLLVMEQRIQSLGSSLRPHVKTHKVVELARRQVAAFSGGITVSTLAEAEHFSRFGFNDITWALPVPRSQIKNALKLAQRIKLNLLLDHPQTLLFLEEALIETNQIASVFLKVDCGYGRAGVDPKSEEAIALAQQLHRSPNIEFCGLLTHAGHSYDCRSTAEIHQISKQERNTILFLAEQLRELNVPVPCISIGSTPTMSVVDNLDGIDEVRPGNYVFFDRAQVNIGSCEVKDIAFSVLSTVIGIYPHRKEILIDAGGIALSKDEGPCDPEHRYGLIVDPLTQEPIAQCNLHALSQEHGKIRYSGITPPLSIGAQVRILPNHSCMTAAAHATFYLTRGATVNGLWTPVKGWFNQEA